MAAKIKIVLGGQLIGPTRWSIGMTCVGPTAAPLPVDLGTFANQAFTDFNNSAWSTTASGATALKGLTTGTLDSCRVYFYPSGQTVASVVAASTNAPIGGVGSSKQAPQIALVCSLLTGLAGRKYRGRIYLPANALNMSTDGHVTANVVQPVAVSVANWLSLLATRNLAGTPVTPVVGSATATPTLISTVRVDDVLDTQRRRRDQMVPTAVGTANIVVG